MDGPRVLYESSLNRTRRGWDWLSLQLDDNTELMLYRFRDKGWQHGFVFGGNLR